MPKLLTTEERQQLSRQLDRTDSAPVELDAEMLMLAHQMSEIHGRIRVSREASGIHFYMAALFNQPVACDENDMPVFILSGWPTKTRSVLSQ